MQRSSYRPQKICESCDEHPATLYCIQCGGYLCPQCDSQLHQNKLAKKHQRILNSESERFEPIKCKEHGYHVQLLCADCQQLICPDCYQNAHRTHAYQPIHEAFDIVKQELRRSEDTLYQRESQVLQLNQEVEQRLQDLNHNFDEIRQRTLDNFQELENLLAAKKGQIVSQLEQQHARLKSGIVEKDKLVKTAAQQISAARQAIMQGKNVSSGIQGSGELYQQKAAFAIYYFLENYDKIQAAVDPDSQAVQQIDNMLIDVQMEPYICLDLENVQKFIYGIEGLYLAIYEIGY